ncbi:MAG: DUF2263 domain-containing protein [Patescibacteria group bacterium]|nr:DUF2263 domain-containing protein [Patescibacteria group bacterium]
MEFEDTKKRASEYKFTTAQKIAASPAKTGNIPRVKVARMDCLKAAELFACKGVKPTLLNFANNETPGGSTKIKGNTQEEQIFKRSNACLSLVPSLYPIDGAEEKEPSLLLSETVTVFKGTSRPFEMSLVSCAAIKLPSTRMDGDGYYFRKDAERDITELKMRVILASAPTNVLILGAWGLGAFAGPLEGTVDLWKKVIRDGYAAKCVSHVLFAIYSPDKEEETRLAKAFAPLGRINARRG